MANEKKEYPKQASEVSKVEAQEKLLLSTQRLVLDIANPLLFIRESLVEDDTLKNSPIASATDTALRLWANKFYSITKSRWENLLCFTNPQFISLLEEPSRFVKYENKWLFGDTFIDRIVKEASDDQKLRRLAHESGFKSRYYPRNTGPSGSFSGKTYPKFGKRGGYSGGHGSS